MNFLRSILLCSILLISMNGFSQWGHASFLGYAMAEEQPNVRLSHLCAVNDSSVVVSYSYRTYPKYDGPYIVKTSNNYGSSWQTTFGASNEMESYLSTMASTNDQGTIFTIGYCTMRTYINHSHDEGITWDEDLLGWTNITSAHLHNHDSIFMVTKEGQWYLWTENDMDTLGTISDIVIAGSETSFPGRIHGYLLNKTYPENIVMSTNDGGFTWENLEVTHESELNSIEFINDSIGFVACDDGILLKTINYGETWFEIETNVNSDLVDLQFLNETLGFCLKDRHGYIVTKDGGNSWEEVNITNDPYPLQKICMFSEDRGYMTVKAFGPSLFGVLSSETSTVMINENRPNEIQIYPNPASDYIQFSNYENDESGIKLSVYDLTGRKLDEVSNVSGKYSISHLTKGIYIIEVLIGKNRYTEKFIIE